MSDIPHQVLSFKGHQVKAKTAKKCIYQNHDTEER